MDKETVIISVETYDKLRKFERALNEEKRLTINADLCYGGFRMDFYTDDEIVKEVTEEYNKLKQKLEEFKCKVSEFGNMSVKEFRKRKRNGGLK